MGKGQILFFTDADKNAVERGVLHCMNNTGQSCNAATRMLVERGIYEEAIEIAAKVANRIKVGKSNASDQHLGPVISQAQYDKIQSLIKSGITEAAHLVTGGLGLPLVLRKFTHMSLLFHL